MKVKALQRFRRKLQANEPVYGMCVTLEAAAVTDIATGLGLDWVVIDAEHAHLDWSEILEHIRATVRSETVALVRLAEASPGSIQRALDIGADGVVIPGIDTAEQLQSVVAWSCYAPAGTRGVGNGRATLWGRDRAHQIQECNANILVVPAIETLLEVGTLREMVGVKGVDLFLLDPPNDSAKLPDESGSSSDAVEPHRILQEIRSQEKYAGIIAITEKSLKAYRTQGFSMLGLGFDGSFILEGIHNALDSVGEAWSFDISSAK
jgi:2-keto-3-deoxy-L-rhamnonate aldolase RhmA